MFKKKPVGRHGPVTHGLTPREKTAMRISLNLGIRRGYVHDVCDVGDDLPVLRGPQISVPLRFTAGIAVDDAIHDAPVVIVGLTRGPSVQILGVEERYESFRRNTLG